MKRIALLLFLLALTLIGCASLSGETDTASSGPVPEDRFARLLRGINTSHWFAQAEVSPDRFRTYITADDVRLIRTMGFRHIRLSLNPDVLFLPDAPGTLRAEHLRHLDDALSTILAEGLAVIVDLHPESAFKHRLAEDSAFVDDVVQFWGALAAHLRRRDPDYVFLEVMNEPEFEDAAHWARVQARLLAAMREAAPRHTLIATGPRWSSPVELVKITPVEDPNVVYNFHFYEPHNFTHQGATWGFSGWQHLHSLPYPSSPEALAPILPQLDDTGRPLAARYGEERWDEDRIEEHIRPVVAWAALHGVRLTCNEFGVYRKEAPPEARLRWIHDVRTVLERHGIGWAMWDYAGGFAVVISENGRRTGDPGTLQALGLME